MNDQVRSDGVTAWINDFGCRLVINVDGEEHLGRTSSLSTPQNKPDGLQVRSTKRDISYTKLARSLTRLGNHPVNKVGLKGTWNDQRWVASRCSSDAQRLRPSHRKARVPAMHQATRSPAAADFGHRLPHRERLWLTLIPNECSLHPTTTTGLLQTLQQK